MDPLSHTLVTRAVLRRVPLTWRQAFVLGNWPDIGYYALYPAWLARTGKLRSLVTEEAPVPPKPLELAYNVTHSLPLVVLAALVLGRKLGWTVFLAWAAHILLDAPTHSRRIYTTRLLWPLSNWSMDGWSWAEVLHARVRHGIAQRRLHQVIDNPVTGANI